MKRISVFLALLMVSYTLSAQPRKVSASLVRPAAVTTYEAGDVVNDSSGRVDLMTFSNAVAFAGTGGRVVNAFVAFDSMNVAYGSIRLWIVEDTTLTDTTGIEIPGDNEPLTLLSAWRGHIAGYIDFTLITGGAGSTMAIGFTTPTQPIYFQTRTSTNIYGFLTVQNAYVPAQYANVRVVLTIE